MPAGGQRDGAPAGPIFPWYMGCRGPHGDIHMGTEVIHPHIAAAECLVALRPVLATLVAAHADSPTLNADIDAVVLRGYMVTDAWLRLLYECLDTRHQPDDAAVRLLAALVALDTRALETALAACVAPDRYPCSPQEAQSRCN